MEKADRKIQIEPVSAENVQDFLDFFDGLGFEDHPDWKICYCYSFHFTGTGEEWNIPGRNRECARDYIINCKMRGYLAYHDGKPVGWCNANDKNNYERFSILPEIPESPDKKVCSVVCFVISPEFRGRGIASGLLSRICEDYKKKGYDYVEAYPSNDNRKQSDHWQGPPAMYKKRGFVKVSEHKDFILMHKYLKRD